MFDYWFLWTQRESNPWPSACKADALANWAMGPKKLKEKLKDVFTEGLEPSCPIRRRCFEPMCIPFHEVNLSMTIELVEMARLERAFYSLYVIFIEHCLLQLYIPQYMLPQQSQHHGHRNNIPFLSLKYWQQNLGLFFQVYSYSLFLYFALLFYCFCYF